MKFLHIADLHIGKRVNEFNMIEDQKYILGKILQIIDEEKIDGVLIAGDVYDKSLPTAEAVELLDEFLTKLAVLGNSVFMISGNHDSPERLGFGSRIMQKNGLYIAGLFDGTLQKVSMRDEYGIFNIYLLPFLKPAVVRPFFDQPIESYEEAVRAMLSTVELHEHERHVLVAHQFVIHGIQQPECSDSEMLSIGGLDHVESSAFDGFDYVALGHLHGPQKMGRETIRYAGSPLKYSFSEARHQKSVVLIEFKSKGTIDYRLIPLTPKRDLREIKGPIAELIRAGQEDTACSEDYIHAILTDEEEIYDAIGQMRQVYPNLMALDFENSRSRQGMSSQTAASGDIARKSPLDLFSDFYQLQNNIDLSPEQLQVMEQIFEQAGGSGI